MNGSLEQYREAIEDKSLKLGVIGPGCVGIPIAVELAGKDFESCKITPNLIRSMDRVLTPTDHSSWVIDARNATKNLRKGREEIVLLGDGK